MAKLSTKVKEQPTEPTWYTVRWSYPEPLRGGAVGGSLEVRSNSKAEAQAAAMAKLPNESQTWENITIVKGRDPGLTRSRGMDRHHAELRAMLGTGHHSYQLSDEVPHPIWANPSIMPDPSATATAWWEKFIAENSHGLSVSAFPRFIIPDVDGYSALPLPTEAVRDRKQWGKITEVVREQLDFWRATLQERIEQRGKAKRHSAGDADRLKRDKAELKELKAFDRWTYQDFVERILPGWKPALSDIDNPRLYRLSNGEQIPTANIGPDHLKIEFWKRLLRIWESPVDTRAERLRHFLDYHHSIGGKPEVFRDLVKLTVGRLRELVTKGAAQGPHFVPGHSLHDVERWGLLADKLEGWLSNAERRRVEANERNSTHVLMRGHGSGEQWIKTWQREAIEKRSGPLEPVEATIEQLRDYVSRYLLNPKPPFSILPFGGPRVDLTSADMIHPFFVLRDWGGSNRTALLCDVEPFEARVFLIWRFHSEVLRRWNESIGYDPVIRSDLLRRFFNHHATKGGNEAAFIQLLEDLFLSGEPPPAPRSVAARITKSELKSTVPDGLKAEVRAWMEDRRKAMEASAKAMDPNTWPDLKSLALFHAYRVEAGDDSADINPNNAQHIAHEAGHKARSSGRTLLESYRNYATGNPEKRKRERTKEGKRLGDVANRFTLVLDRLLLFPDALTIARAEHRIVRTRSNGSED